jgi:hypothetical protein
MLSEGKATTKTKVMNYDIHQRPQPVASQSLLAPSVEIGTANQKKPRVAAPPSKAEKELLAMLAKAPKPTMQFIPGSGSPRAVKSKEEDPEEVHYPGFDICADEDEENDGGEQQRDADAQNAQVENMDAEDEDEEEGSKENQAPYVSSGGDPGYMQRVDGRIRRTPYVSPLLPSAHGAACHPSAPHAPAPEPELHAIVCRLKSMRTHSATMTTFSRIRMDTMIRHTFSFSVPYL